MILVGGVAQRQSLAQPPRNPMGGSQDVFLQSYPKASFVPRGEECGPEAFRVWGLFFPSCAKCFPTWPGPLSAFESASAMPVTPVAVQISVKWCSTAGWGFHQWAIQDPGPLDVTGMYFFLCNEVRCTIILRMFYFGMVMVCSLSVAGGHRSGQGCANQISTPNCPKPPRPPGGMASLLAKINSEDDNFHS